MRIGIQCRTADTRAAFDPARIAQVVRNLLSNALKFTPAEREVTVIVESCDLAGAAVAPGARSPALRVTVSDEGVGIPDDELEAVFDKFIQSSSTKSGAGGTGPVLQGNVVAIGGGEGGQRGLGDCAVIGLYRFGQQAQGGTSG